MGFWGQSEPAATNAQLAVLSIGWAAFFHSAQDGVHHSPFFFASDHCTFFSFFL
jgi:hypothetical protein